MNTSTSVLHEITSAVDTIGHAWHPSVRPALERQDTDALEERLGALDDAMEVLAAYRRELEAELEAREWVVIREGDQRDYQRLVLDGLGVGA